MRLIYRSGRIEIWEIGLYYVLYGVTDGGDPITCPSLGIAYEVAGLPLIIINS
jgi:hypothetical protein